MEGSRHGPSSRGAAPMKLTAEVGREVRNAEPYSREWWLRYTARLRLYKAAMAPRGGGRA